MTAEHFGVSSYMPGYLQTSGINRLPAQVELFVLLFKTHSNSRIWTELGVETCGF